MPKKGANISLNSYDEIFTTEEDRQKQLQEKVQEIPLAELHPFKDHPFKVKDDEAMEKTVESIRQYGVLVPAIARPLPEGDYELISGHRRKHASELAGKETMPVIVRQMSDDEATILMADSNLQREEILPSERAFAYKMKNEAMKRRTGRIAENNRGQVGHNSVGTRTVELIAEQSGESAKQVQRFIRLTNLIPEMLDLVDEKKIAFNPAVELSYLKPEEQKDFIQAMENAVTSPSLSQAQRIKKFSQQGMCTMEIMQTILDEDKKAPLDRVVLDNKVIGKYFPKSYTPKQMEDTIIRLLEQWQKKRQRDQER